MESIKIAAKYTTLPGCEFEYEATWFGTYDGYAWETRVGGGHRGPGTLSGTFRTPATMDPGMVARRDVETAIERWAKTP